MKEDKFKLEEKIKLDFSGKKAKKLGCPDDKFEDFNDFIEYVYPEDRDKVIQAMKDHLEGKKDRYDVKYRLKTEEGDYRWFRDIGWLSEEEKYKNIVGRAIDIEEQKRAEEGFDHIFQNISRVTGERFFKEIIGELDLFFDTDVAFIGKIPEEDKEKVQSLAMIKDNEEVDYMEYHLSDAPCKKVIEEGPCLFSKNVVDEFPDDEDLKELDAEGYAGVPIRDSRGEPLGILWVISRDELDPPKNWKKAMTLAAARAGSEIERLEAERKVKESRSRLIRTQKVAKVGTWELNPETEELEWSDETYNIFDIPKEKEIDYDKFLEHVHPEDRKFIDEKKKEAFESGDFDIEHRIEVDGETKWVRDKAEIEFDEKGEPTEIIGSVQDITERKEAEIERKEVKKQLENGLTRLRKLIELSPDAIILTDTETGEIVDVNQETEELIKKPRDEIIGKNQMELHPLDERDKYWNLVNDSLEETSQRSEDYGEIKVIDSEGKKIPTEVRMTSFEMENRRMVQEIFRDIRLRKRHRRKEFLYSLFRQDVNNKLGVIIGYLQLLERDKEVDEKIKEKLEKAHDSAKKTVDLVNVIEKVNKSDSEVSDIVKVEDMVENIAEGYEDKDIESELDCPSRWSGLDDKVKIGPYVTPLLIKLIEKRAEKADANHIQMTGETFEDEVVLRIEDDGEKIPDKTKARFSNDTYSGDTSGMGGPVYFATREIIRNHDGKMEFKDSELGGAKFELHFRKPKEKNSKKEE